MLFYIMYCLYIKFIENIYVYNEVIYIYLVNYHVGISVYLWYFIDFVFL